MKNVINNTITVYVPGRQCNLRCSYCYVSQCFDESKLEKAEFLYPVEHMIKAFSAKRIGISDILLIGGGETLLPPEIIPFVLGLLREGHYVEIVTNLTLQDRIKAIVEGCTPSMRERLLITGSLHYIELKKRGLLDTYFDIINYLRRNGVSCYPLLTISNEYVPLLEEIREVCLERINTLPQCQPAFKYLNKSDIFAGGKFLTDPVCDDDFVKKIDKLFQSKVFDFEIKMLPVNQRRLFCYAGQYGFIVDMKNGKVSKCHGFITNVNFFENLDKIIELEPVACECRVISCACQYRFLGQGFIPELKDIPTYGDIIKTGTLVKKKFLDAMQFKYYESKKRLNSQEEREFLMDCITQYEGVRAENNKLKGLLAKLMKQQ